MKEQLLRNALIRFDNVRADIESPLFEGCTTKGGSVLVREYDRKSPWRPSALFKKILKELAGEFGDELKRLRKHELRPVLFVDFNLRCVSLFRVLISNEDLKRRRSNKQSIAIATPSAEADGSESKCIEFPVEIVDALARYGFSIEIYGL